MGADRQGGDTAAAATVPAGAGTGSDGTAAHEPLRLSFSRIDLYRQCPLRYRYRYIDGLPEQPSPALSFGSSIHAALERFWDRKLPDPPPVETLLDALYAHWDTAGFAAVDRSEQARYYRHARDVLVRHHERFAETRLAPVAVEQWFEVPLPDAVTLVGSIDLVVPTAEGGIGIVDWKTNRAAKRRSDVAASLQLAIYALASRHLWGHEPDWVALDFVVPGVRVQVDREDIDLDRALRVVGETAAAIRAGHFPATPSPLCRWCDFRGECPAWEGEGPDVAATAVTELRTIRRRQARDAERAGRLTEIIGQRLGPDALDGLTGAPDA